MKMRATFNAAPDGAKTVLHLVLMLDKNGDFTGIDFQPVENCKDDASSSATAVGFKMKLAPELGEEVAHGT